MYQVRNTRRGRWCWGFLRHRGKLRNHSMTQDMMLIFHFFVFFSVGAHLLVRADLGGLFPLLAEGALLRLHTHGILNGTILLK